MKKNILCSLILSALLLFSCSSGDNNSIAVTEVTLNRTTQSLAIGNTFQLRETVNPANATNKAVTWNSSDNTKAKVSSSGMVTAVNSGQVNITVTTKDGGKTATCTFTVAQLVNVTGVSLDITEWEMFPKRTKQLTHTVVPADATNKTITWSSNDETKVTVSSGGLITAISEGSATITVTTEDGGKTASCYVTVNERIIGANGVDVHGKLSVNGADLVDKNGEKVQLYGMSTHGIAWFPQYINYDTFITLRDELNTNCVRIAMYTAESGGYCTNGDKESLKTLVKNGINLAVDLDMYVIIDWHVLNDNPSNPSMNGDPNFFIEEAKAFFSEMSALYKDRDNVLYEICNEPNGIGVTWNVIKNYANEIIPIIRANNPDAIILVGTPTWSQDIHLALQSPLEFDNIMYSLHFYAATHRDSLRQRLDNSVLNGLPVFVNEFAICSASGDGGNDFESGRLWMELIMKHNLSFIAWNIANKAESSSIFVPGSMKISDWTDDDLTEWGKWIKGYF